MNRTPARCQHEGCGRIAYYAVGTTTGLVLYCTGHYRDHRNI